MITEFWGVGTWGSDWRGGNVTCWLGGALPRQSLGRWRETRDEKGRWESWAAAPSLSQWRVSSMGGTWERAWRAGTGVVLKHPVTSQRAWFWVASRREMRDFCCLSVLNHTREV